jgi:hypothetical protein
MSQAAGTFYKNLIDAGMEKQDALYLTEEYLNTIKFVTKQYGNS